jgi:Na+/phosphate symporter
VTTSPPSRPPRVHWLRRINGRKLAILLLALFLFILAIQLLKTGAKAVTPFIGGFAVHNIANALGFGWLFAYVVLSGSPVAATTLAFFNDGAIDRYEAFAMIAGSRFGASFIVLGLGFVYALRGHERKGSLVMGLLSLVVTFTTYAPALVIGYWLLQMGALDGLPAAVGGNAVSFLDVIFDRVVNLTAQYLPRPLVFLLGFAVLWYSLNLIDHALPDMRLRESAFGGMARLLYRPIVTFALGLVITSLTMSVSVSLSVLVPLSARGYIRRENVIPYVMGANITTFVDTLVAALLLNNPQAFSVVLVEMVSVAFVSLLVLLLVYRRYERAIEDVVELVGASRRNLALFLLLIVGIPVALMFIR